MNIKTENTILKKHNEILLILGIFHSLRGCDLHQLDIILCEFLLQLKIEVKCDEKDINSVWNFVTYFL